jgi:protein kinase domain-containing protein
MEKAVSNNYLCVVYVVYLQLALGIAQILHHLAHSPLGSLSMNDFRRQQFVLVGGTLKLSDVDDLGVGEPECETDADCVIGSGLSDR